MAEASAGMPPRERWRLFKDRCFALVMAVGGVAVIVAILLIFFYLLYVVVPLFRGATVTAQTSYASPSGASALVTFDEYAETGVSVAPDGAYRFFTIADGHARDQGGTLAAARAGAVTSLAAGDPATQVLFAGTDRGNVVVAQATFDIEFKDDRRVITPGLRFVHGTRGLRIARGDPIRLLAGQASDEETTLIAFTAGGRAVLVNVAETTSFLDGETTRTTSRAELDIDAARVTHAVVARDHRSVYVVTADGALSYFDVRNKNKPRLVDRASVVDGRGAITALAFLAGGVSIVVGDDRGRLSQWFAVRDEHGNYQLKRVRRFSALPAAIVRIAPEHHRKAFAALADDGTLALYHATAERELVRFASGRRAARALIQAPRADTALIAGADGRIDVLALDNPHPEVSLKSLWGKVWYEHRAAPDYIWQSSSASSDFEPKYSLMPLTFGTLKAALYSMLFAIPLAVLGAIYTAYFMRPALRALVKPSIEVMAALPTVILGFLAGLWLAPLIERELLGILSCFVLLPLAVLAASFGFSRAPRALTRLVPEGCEALALIPVICLATWFALTIGQALEATFFDGNLPYWLNVEYGLTYDQRNTLVVAIAIGFAVIPTIFSISEDAVFSVPRHLTMGSLALGATPWQTATRVVLLTASPGIFSAVMIGMGRAVGETMIVLMATGNTPIMDVNVFQGLRALSANIAVEMPESEVGSTHYRILFLAAMVLFLATFVVNTLAEIVRQRLRRRYASL